MVIKNIQSPTNTWYKIALYFCIPFRKMKFAVVIFVAVATLIINSCCAYTVPTFQDAKAVMLGLALTYLEGRGASHDADTFLEAKQMVIRINVDTFIQGYRSEGRFRFLLQHIGMKVKFVEQETVKNFLEFIEKADERVVVQLLKKAQNRLRIEKE